MSSLFPLNPPPRPRLIGRRIKTTAAFLTVALLALAATPVLAGPVTLKANPADADGRVTLGDVFDGAGAASGVQIATRSGPSVVMEAGQLQALARQAGLDWDNPRGLRRVVIRNAALAPATEAAPEAVAAESAARPAVAPVRAAPAERVIARNDLVTVAYEVGGIRLTVMGRAQANAAPGEPVPVRNASSGRIIDAVAVAAGRAVAGPAADHARANPQLFAR